MNVKLILFFNKECPRNILLLVLCYFFEPNHLKSSQLVFSKLYNFCVNFVNKSICICDSPVAPSTYFLVKKIRITELLILFVLFNPPLLMSIIKSELDWKDQFASFLCHDYCLLKLEWTYSSGIKNGQLSIL